LSLTLTDYYCTHITYFLFSAAFHVVPCTAQLKISLYKILCTGQDTTYSQFSERKSVVCRLHIKSYWSHKKPEIQYNQAIWKTFPAIISKCTQVGYFMQYKCVLVILIFVFLFAQAKELQLRWKCCLHTYRQGKMS